MKSFNDILSSVSFNPPQEKPQYPSQSEIENASIERLAFWVLFLPILNVDDPKYKEKWRSHQLIARRIFELRKSEGSWEGPPPEFRGPFGVENERQAETNPETIKTNSK